MAYTKLEAEAIGHLRAFGWRVRHRTDFVNAVKNFQEVWMLGTRLVKDGKVGAKTIAAMRKSRTANNAKKPNMSKHFSFIEFRCKCGGKYSGCKRIWIRRSLVASAEKYRARLGSRAAVVSGCRCTGHNRAVRGASNSQHLYGLAWDMPAQLSVSTVKGLRTFSGIGYASSNGRVRHGDRRRGSLTSPTVWRYA